MKTFTYFLVLCALVSFSSPVFAHKTPDTCSGSGLSIGLYTSKNEAYIGDAVNFSVDLFNGGMGPVVCNATGITASITTPDGVTHPVSLTRTSLANGDIDSYSEIVSYSIRAQDVVNGKVVVTARTSGTIHQNDTDSQGGGDQGVNIQILTVTPPTIDTPVTPPQEPPPPPVIRTRSNSRSTPRPPVIDLVKTASTEMLPVGGGDVLYTYVVSNPGRVALQDVTLEDDMCSPTVGPQGDEDNDEELDTDEVWTYTCADVLSQTTTNIATATGHANNKTVTATSTATVFVPLMSFPDTGLPPQDWNIVIMAFLFITTTGGLVLLKVRNE